MHTVMRHANSGFTLVELAIGMVVIALLLGGILAPLKNQVEARKYDETQRMLNQAREAILGYAVANGYFPCPADTTSNGAEALPPDPPTPPHDSAIGFCAASTGDGTAGYHGFLPARTLGFTPVDDQGYGVDAWGVSSNRIRYSLYADASTIGKSLVRSGGMANLGIPVLGGASLFNVCLSGTAVGAADCGAATPPSQVTLASNAVVIIWSVGSRSAAASVHETENLNNNRVFVNRTRSDVSGNEFDDVMTWIPMTVVISRMVAGGQLP
jgi:prepilin-type N-terminal cleavage/methylation domain-containing protein